MNQNTNSFLNYEQRKLNYTQIEKLKQWNINSKKDK